MPTLSELQQVLSGLLRSRTSLLSSEHAITLAKLHIAPNARLAPAEQLEIYREQFWLRHTTSLLEDFPGLSGILGQADWERLVEGYLEAHPPESFGLRDLGARLPEYVAQQEWIELAPLCRDMARLEWAYIECFDAPDSSPLDPGEIQRIPPDAWETARLAFAPSLQLLRTNFPVAALRRALRRSQQQGGSVPLPPAEPQNLVIYRRDRDLHYQLLPLAAYELLQQLLSSVPLAASIQAVVDRGVIDAADVNGALQSWFRDWASLGWVVNVVPGA